jgi:hypothetical protein
MEPQSIVGYPPRGTSGHTIKDLKIAKRMVNQSRHLKAAGNLNYLEFIALVQDLWTRGHPDVPLYASSPARQAHYPSITYSLMSRRTHPNEPKPRLREVIDTGASVVDDEGSVLYTNQGTIVYGWRFINIVKFTVHAEVQGVVGADGKRDPGAEIVEALIEEFENFMQEHQYVFKQLGVSELTYNSRLDDEEENRDAEDIVKRAVTYRLTTEKITVVDIDKLLKLVASIRVDNSYNDDATPSPINPYEPFYEQVTSDPNLTLTPGVFERISIIDDNQTIPPE